MISSVYFFVCLSEETECKNGTAQTQPCCDGIFASCTLLICLFQIIFEQSADKFRLRLTKSKNSAAAVMIRISPFPHSVRQRPDFLMCVCHRRADVLCRSFQVQNRIGYSGIILTRDSIN